MADVIEQMVSFMMVWLGLALFACVARMLDAAGTEPETGYMAAPGVGGVCVSAGVCPCGLPPHRTAANARDPRRAFPWPSSAGDFST